MNDNLSDTDKNSPLPPTSKTDSNVSTDADLHLDKYSDPRVKITRTGILMGVGVVIIGILGAGLSIYARKTKLEQTTRFWGPETIIALQLAEKIELRPIGASDFEAVDLSGTPSLGHLRHALLDERGFDWNTEGSGSAAEMCQKPTEGGSDKVHSSTVHRPHSQSNRDDRFGPRSGWRVGRSKRWVKTRPSDRVGQAKTREVFPDDRQCSAFEIRPTRLIPRLAHLGGAAWL